MARNKNKLTTLRGLERHMQDLKQRGLCAAYLACAPDARRSHAFHMWFHAMPSAVLAVEKLKKWESFTPEYVMELILIVAESLDVYLRFDPKSNVETKGDVALLRNRTKTYRRFMNERGARHPNPNVQTAADQYFDYFEMYERDPRRPKMNHPKAARQQLVFTLSRLMLERFGRDDDAVIADLVNVVDSAIDKSQVKRQLDKVRVLSARQQGKPKLTVTRPLLLREGRRDTGKAFEVLMEHLLDEIFVESAGEPGFASTVERHGRPWDIEWRDKSSGRWHIVQWKRSSDRSPMQ